jgi:hypothetical protein
MATLPLEPQFKDVFIVEALKIGCSPEEAENLFLNLPIRLQSHKITQGFDQVWRYMFGTPFHLKKGVAISLPHQMLLVSGLVRSYLVARQRLNTKQYDVWTGTTTRPDKHYDALAEMLAVSNVRQEDNLIYEPKGLGVGDKHIEWLLETKNDGFLLEVKNRSGMLAKELDRIAEAHESMPSDPVIDLDKIFKSANNKFHPVVNAKHIQGVALFISLKIPRQQIEGYFFKHIQKQLHFVTLVRDDGMHVNLIAVSEEVKARVLSAFRWVDDADFFL